MARSLNRVQLIGNLTRDPELRYTPNGAAVCTFGVATNRSWTTDTGERKEEVDFHKIVAWNKLAELCSQHLAKGRKVYVEGRLSSRNWTTQDGQQRTTVEVVVDDVLFLDSRRAEEGAHVAPVSHQNVEPEPVEPQAEEAPKSEPKKQTKKETETETQTQSEDVSPDDIPF